MPIREESGQVDLATRGEGSVKAGELHYDERVGARGPSCSAKVKAVEEGDCCVDRGGSGWLRES